MLFSENSRVPIMFEKATFKRTKDGERLARMRFAVELKTDVALHSPAEVRTAFEAVNSRENCITWAQTGSRKAAPFRAARIASHY